MIRTATEFGAMVRAARERQGMTQRGLAMVANTGERFVVDLEAGKETCRLGMALAIAGALGIRLVNEADERRAATGDALPEIPSTGQP